jgi:hypothetical protein
MTQRTFKVVLIKPSHYDDDGYVIQWWKSTIPSNSLASVYGILANAKRNKVLGPDVTIDIEGYDECNTIIDINGTIAAIKAAGSGFVGLVGVQSNQFPRALDLTRQFRAAGVPVVIGGFHVSGCLSMLPELPPDLKEAQKLGACLFAGESEGRLADLLAISTRSRTSPSTISSAISRDGGRRRPLLPRKIVGAGGGALRELRRRARLPVPVLVLHHHQRPGPQVALPHARRRRGDRAGQRQAGHHALLRHRRQFRPQQELGADPRPPDPPARERGFKIRLLLQVDTLCHRIEGLSRNRPARAATRSSSGLRTSTRKA